MSENKKLALELQNVISQLSRAKTLQHDHSNLRGAEKHILLLISKLKSGQPVSISEIANNIRVTLAAVTHQINPLEKQGLVKRSSDTTDRRIVLVELTPKGNSQVQKLKKEFSIKIQALADFFGEKDTKDLIRLINKMSDFPGFKKN